MLYHFLPFRVISSSNVVFSDALNDSGVNACLQELSPSLLKLALYHPHTLHPHRELKVPEFPCEWVFHIFPRKLCKNDLTDDTGLKTFGIHSWITIYSTFKNRHSGISIFIYNFSARANILDDVDFENIILIVKTCQWTFLHLANQMIHNQVSFTMAHCILFLFFHYILSFPVLQILKLNYYYNLHHNISW